MFTRLVAYARGLLARRRIDREVRDELRFHLDQEVDANLAAGMPSDEARRKALAALGGVTQTIEAVRDVRATPGSRIAVDLRDAGRVLWRGRGTTALALAILTIAMTAATTTFSVGDAVAIRPLPFREPRLVAVGTIGSAGSLIPSSPQQYVEWRESARALESVGFARLTAPVPVGGGSDLLTTRRVSADLFDVLGVVPSAGRLFRLDDEGAGAPPTVLISHQLWRRRFGSDAALIGRRIPVGAEIREVLGVLPPEVGFPITAGPLPDVYIPNVFAEKDRQDNRSYSMFVVGRLRADVTLDQARADVQRLGASLVPLHEQVVGSARRPMLLVLTAVGFVLLVACANVATLLLSRSQARARELALREALGASRRRLAAVREDVLARVRAVPGVVAAAILGNSVPPLAGGGVRYSLTIPGLGETPRADWLETKMVTAAYFDAMDIPLQRGRLFDSSDRSGAPPVMVINDVAAARFFPGRDALGQVVDFRGPTKIVGVVRSGRIRGPEIEAPPEMYMPIDQQPGTSFRGSAYGSVIVRTVDSPRSIAAAVRAAMQPALGGNEPGQPQFIGEHFERLTAGRRFNARLMGVLGLMALAIGAAGIYGAMTFVVTQRYRAIGLQLALGATRGRILGAVLGDALRRVAIGSGIGLILAWTLAGALSAFVFGIQPTEPAVYIGVALFLSLVALAAAFVPAFRASRLDPLTVLRLE